MPNMVELDREQRREPPRPRARLVVDGVERKRRAAHVGREVEVDVRREPRQRCPHAELARCGPIRTTLCEYSDPNLTRLAPVAG